jgi:hypothetical protein
MPNYIQTGAANRIYLVALDLKRSVLDLKAIIGWVSSTGAPETVQFATAIYSAQGRALDFATISAGTALQNLTPVRLVPGTEGVSEVTTSASVETTTQVILPNAIRLQGHRNRYFLAFTSSSANAQWAAPGLLGAGSLAMAALEPKGTDWPTTLTRSGNSSTLGYCPVFQLLSEKGAMGLF